MGEVLIQRDETNRVIGLLVRDLAADSAAGLGVSLLVDSVSAVLHEYLHVAVECSSEGDTYLEIDRSDPHLDRELDAVLGTLVSGLRLLEKKYSDRITVHEGSVGVEVL